MPGTQPQPLLDVSSESPTVQSKPKARIAGICTKLASTLVGWSRSLAFSTASFDEGTKDRKSTRLNSSHGYISYAVFCLKKKKKGGHTRSGTDRRLTSAGAPTC